MECVSFSVFPVVRLAQRINGKVSSQQRKKQKKKKKRVKDQSVQSLKWLWRKQRRFFFFGLVTILSTSVFSFFLCFSLAPPPIFLRPPSNNLHPCPGAAQPHPVRSCPHPILTDENQQSLVFFPCRSLFFVLFPEFPNPKTPILHTPTVPVVSRPPTAVHYVIGGKESMALHSGCGAVQRGVAS